MVTYELGPLTRSVYPVDGQEYDAIPVTYLVDGAEYGGATYCLRPGTALATVEDIETRARHEAEVITQALDLLAEHGAVAGTFDDVNVHELAQLR